MKATGIIRRIDDLGRVVILKEVRRTMRIKEGDPLEIFTTREGEVVFKKYNYADEHDWAKAKAIVKALHPDLQFALYDGWGDKQTATNVKFPQSIEFEETNFPIFLEMVLKPLRLGYKFKELPTDCHSRTEGKSSNSFAQIPQYLRTALHVRFMPKEDILKK